MRTPPSSSSASCRPASAAPPRRSAPARAREAAGWSQAFGHLVGALVAAGACPLFALAVAPSNAHAAPARAATHGLTWARLEGAEGCVAPRDLAASVEAQLGRRVFGPASEADRTVDGRVGPRAGGGWRATLRLVDAPGAVIGTRELTSDAADCRSLDEALTLSVSLLVDPAAASGGWADASATAVPSDPAPADAAPADAAPAPRAAGGAGAEPPRRSAPVRAAPRPPPRRRAAGASAAALAGFGFGELAFPSESGVSSGLGLGLGLRGGYGFESGLWLGGSYTYYYGGEYDALAAPGTHYEYADEAPAGRFRVHVPGLEAGYGFALGPFDVRPYVGVGVASYSYSYRVGRAGDLGGPPRLGPGEQPRDFSLAAWPGLAASLPLGDVAFVGVDARWVLIEAAAAHANVGLFASAGVRF